MSDTPEFLQERATWSANTKACVETSEERIRELERALDSIQSQITPMWNAIESDNRRGFITCLSCIEIVLGGVREEEKTNEKA